LSELRGKPCLAVCGIGRPDAFVRTLQALGADIRAQVFFPDHHWYQDRDGARLARLAGKVQAEIVTTAKDAVRLHWAAGPGVKAWSLEVELAFLSGEREIENLLVRILKRA
jgi:tetraacyldisaccharide 4'-kinase